jgi:hypothetical protein
MGTMVMFWVTLAFVIFAVDAAVMSAVIPTVADHHPGA